jgi:hypothetical protein
MPARDGETPPPLDEDQIARIETMGRLVGTVSLPDPA